ncbi:MAG: hypothetical protein HYU36_10815 [Planctomycetes bacterium]|nr:hypothetical protein [Planctomycetota bacterium]
MPGSMFQNLFRRRNLWIHTGLQLRVILYCVLSSMVIGIFVALAMYALLWNKVGQLQTQYVGRSAGELFPLSLPEILPWVGAIFLAVLLCAVSIGLIVSHQIAGPLFRLKRAFTDIGAGKLETRVKLRPMDGLKDVADLLNETMTAVQSRDIERAERLGAAEEALGALPDRLDQQIRLTVEQQEKIQKARSMFSNAMASTPES